MFNVGGAEVLVICLLALLVLGPDKLPDAARSAGKMMRQVRSMTEGFQHEVRNAMAEADISKHVDATLNPKPTPKPAPTGDVHPGVGAGPSLGPAPSVGSPPAVTPEPAAPEPFGRSDDPTSAPVRSDGPDESFT